MADYRFYTGGGVMRNSDGAIIPDNSRNRDCRKYQQWVDGGGVTDPAPPPPPAPLPEDAAESGVSASPGMAALVRRIAKKEGITERALLDEIRAEAKEVVGL